jgi:hypothetical protein
VRPVTHQESFIAASSRICSVQKDIHMTVSITSHSVSLALDRRLCLFWSYCSMQFVDLRELRPAKLFKELATPRNLLEEPWMLDEVFAQKLDTRSGLKLKSSSESNDLLNDVGRSLFQ